MGEDSDDFFVVGQLAGVWILPSGLISQREGVGVTRFTLIIGLQQARMYSPVSGDLVLWISQ